MVLDAVGDASELYDHTSDPWEMNNLYNDPAHRHVRLELIEEFVRFYDRTEQQNLTTSLRVTGDGGYMPPGPTHDDSIMTRSM